MLLYQGFNAGLSSCHFGHSNSDYRHVDLSEWKSMLLSHPYHHGHFVHELMVLVKETDWYFHKWSSLSTWLLKSFILWWTHFGEHLYGIQILLCFLPIPWGGYTYLFPWCLFISFLTRFLPRPWYVLPHLCCSWVTSRIRLQVNILAVNECSPVLTNILPATSIPL
jgi:hypothetical protein